MPLLGLLLQAPALSRPVDPGSAESISTPRTRGPRLPREDPEPNPLEDDPRADRRLVDRLMQIQPTRPDCTPGERRVNLERAVDWLNAIAVTISRVGYRIEWRLSPMPVRWRPDDRGIPFDLSDYLTDHGWVPLGQLYGCPRPTDNPLPEADFVYPPYSEDERYVAWFAKIVRTWAYFHNSQSHLERRRELYAERMRRFAAARAGRSSALCALQEPWELREVSFRGLRWVDSRRPDLRPQRLSPIDALPEYLHPCGVWGDLLESPTEREEEEPYPPLPMPDMDKVEPPPGATYVFPVLRDPLGREAHSVRTSLRRASAEGRPKRTRAEDPSVPSSAPSAEAITTVALRAESPHGLLAPLPPLSPTPRSRRSSERTPTQPPRIAEPVGKAR